MVFYPSFSAKFGVCRSKMVDMSTFVLVWLYTLLVLMYFVGIVHTKFHTQSGVCSSRNEWVIQNLESVGKKWLIHEYFCTCLYFLHYLYFCTLVGLAIQSSTQNLELLIRMSMIWLITVVIFVVCLWSVLEINRWTY